MRLKNLSVKCPSGTWALYNTERIDPNPPTVYHPRFTSRYAQRNHRALTASSASSAKAHGHRLRSRRLQTRRRVALKFLPEDTRRDPQTLERFLREARALPRSIILASAPFTPSRNPMAHFHRYGLLEGRPRQAHTPWRAPIPRTIEIGIQLADALDAAHKKASPTRHPSPPTFRHRARRQNSRFFGLASSFPNTTPTSAAKRRSRCRNSSPHQPRHRRRTISYMSPEQARGEDSMVAATSSSAPCSIKSLRQATFPAAPAPSYSKHLAQPSDCSITLNPDVPPSSSASSQSPRKRPRRPLPGRRRTPRRPQAPPARIGLRQSRSLTSSSTRIPANCPRPLSRRAPLEQLFLIAPPAR